MIVKYEKVNNLIFLEEELKYTFMYRLKYLIIKKYKKKNNLFLQSIKNKIIDMLYDYIIINNK